MSASETTAPTQAADLPVLRIAFVGNSFTYFNDMPHMLSQIFATAPNPTKLEIEQVTPGGQNFAGHAEDEKVHELLNPDKKFDYFVLQDNSNVPGGGASGKKRVESVNILKNAFVPKLKVCGAKPLLYSSWGHKNGTKYDSYRKDYFDFHSMNRLTELGYELYAKTLEECGVSCQVVPANKAFWLVYKHVFQNIHGSPPPNYEEAKQRYAAILEAHKQNPPPAAPAPAEGETAEAAPSLPGCPDSVCEAGTTYFSRLFMPDDFHPTKLGTYMIACVFYAQITGNSPRGLVWYPPAEITEFDIKMKGKFGETFEPEVVTQEDAAFVQDIAHRAVFGETRV